MKKDKMQELRDLLMAEVVLLKEKKTSVASVNAIRGCVSSVLATVREELAYNKAQGKTPVIEFMEKQNEQ